MAAMRKVLIATVVAAFAALIGHRFLQLKEIFLASREIPVKHLNCQYIQNIEGGAEDITILPDGLAFISTGLKHPALPSLSDEPGKLYILDLLHPKPTPVELKIKGDLDVSSLNPHGISVYTDEADDSLYLFVVNHPQHNSQVEIFKFVEENTLVHLKTITHPLLHSVNDIVAVGVESFYATNDRAFPSDVLNLLSFFVGFRWCEVIYYSPKEARVAARGLVIGNGINISPDRRHIYVVDSSDHTINVFERKEGEQLQFIKAVDVDSICDNIEVDPRTGDIWLGCHPNGMKFMNFNTEDPPGSEVIKIKNIHSEKPVISQEYADNGRVIMASSVAAPFEGKLLIGTVFHKALSCDLK